MSTHAAQPSTVSGLGTERLNGVVTHAQAVEVVRGLVDAQAENRRQELLVYNPSPEADSLAELLVLALRRGNDPSKVLADSLPLLRELVESNRREHGHVHAATGPVNFVARMLADHTTRQGLGIKRAARMLREPLKIIRDDMTAPAGRRDGLAFFHASCKVRDVIGEMTTEALRSASMRAQLGTGLHEVLCSLLTDGATENEAA
jgi:hypothetical protein